MKQLSPSLFVWDCIIILTFNRFIFLLSTVNMFTDTVSLPVPCCTSLKNITKSSYASYAYSYASANLEEDKNLSVLTNSFSSGHGWILSNAHVLKYVRKAYRTFSFPIVHLNIGKQYSTTENFTSWRNQCYPFSRS